MPMKKIRGSLAHIMQKYDEFPHLVEIGHVRPPKKVEDVRVYIINWMRANGFGGPYNRFWVVPRSVTPIKLGGWRIRFKNDTDAMLFKLRSDELIESASQVK